MLIGAILKPNLTHSLMADKAPPFSETAVTKIKTRGQNCLII